MAKLVYGTRNFITFNNLNEVYETIGMLTKENYSQLRIEYNQLSGAWAKEGRIYIYSSPDKFLNPITSRFTAGRGRILYRVNCNDFIMDLIHNHGFNPIPQNSRGRTARVWPPSYNVGLSLVPQQYQADFIRGYNK